jgi:hypothetical protein
MKVCKTKTQIDNFFLLFEVWFEKTNWRSLTWGWKAFGKGYKTNCLAQLGYVFQEIHQLQNHESQFYFIFKNGTLESKKKLSFQCNPLQEL